jgi:tetratricopeptide (TPR) repeat protein/predicted Ser/Thr protein kinase
MQCPLCQAENLPSAAVCTKCSTPLPLNDDDLGATIADQTLTEGPPPRATYAWSVAVDPPAGAPSAQGEELIGAILAERYEILALLGQGGMGAVYKARDTELDRLVALKLIRPELASNPEILRRFKQELILAREVTHRNVIRIFDLGQAKGIKFITMEFVEGRDLRVVLKEKGKLPPDEAVQIISQVCRALEAAHAAGVVHRDLKPQNIMLDAKDRVFVMDFGIAHSLETPGMTQTGALMGTPEYMSPEQARGMKVDERSDLFALGIIFYELLTGVSPYKADTAIATLLKRTQERAQPPADVDPSIPKNLSDVVMKCLEIDRDQRYPTAREIFEDLGHEMPTSVRTVPPTMLTQAAAGAPNPVEVSLFQRYRIWIAGIAAVVLIVAAGFAFRGKIFSGSTGRNSAPVEQASIAILPFRNASGDSSLDWYGSSIANVLDTDIGQSAYLRIVSPDRIHQIVKDMRIAANSDLDPDTLQRISVLSNADMVIWGQYTKVGDKILINANLKDLKRQQTVALDSDAAEQSALVSTVDKLAQSVRANLSLSSSALRAVKAAAFTPTSSSIEAIRHYTEGLELTREGNHIEALKPFEEATQADPNFALAYCMLAQTYARLGNQRQAEENASKSVDLSGNLSPAEKYMIQAANSRIGNNYQNALDAYSKLEQLMPNDAQIQFELGELHDQHGEYDKAHDHYNRALQDDPKHLDALRSIGYVEYERGNPQGSLDYLNRALTLAVELNNREGKATVLQNLGQSYALLNRPQDALQNFQQSLEIERQIGDKKGMAAGLDQMAFNYALLGNSTEAQKTYEQELNLRKEVGDQDGLGIALLNFGAFLQGLGRLEEALATAKQALQIELQLGNQVRQATCLFSIGGMNFQMAKFDDALTYQQRAVDVLQKLQLPSDLAMNLGNLGLTYATIGQFDQALNSYLQGLEQARKTGDKTLISGISDDMAQMFAIQGRYGAALSAQQDAVANAQQLERQTGTFLAESRADYASILNQLGRGQEAEKILDESLAAARSAHEDVLTAKILNFQGEGFYYRGDFKSARPLFAQSQPLAEKAKDRIATLTAKFNLARLSVKDGHAAAAISTLKGLSKEANSLELRYVAAQCSTALGEALLRTGDYPHAQEELQTVVRKSEDLGMKSLLPEGHYLLSEALRKKGATAEAERQLQQAAQLVEQMHQESHTEALLQRSDLKAILEDSKK